MLFNRIPVIDFLAGPGGLAEGFPANKNDDIEDIFNMSA